MSYLIGAARIEITPHILGVVMLGWGDTQHRVQGIATPLYARAIVIVDSEKNKRFVMLCLDLCFTTEILRREIVSRLGFQDEEIMISATHTHSAPGGYSGDVFYDLSTLGFRKDILAVYVDGAVKAVELALARIVHGEIRFGTGTFANDEPVAFNRSMRARNRNTDVIKLPRKDRHLAVDREMTLLRFDQLDGTPIASWNWFSVHATSMHRDHFLIHSDNKGVAAADMEKSFHGQGYSDFVSVFAQGAAGDVTPNLNWFRGVKEKRGLSASDEESCQKNADFQRKKAEEIFQRISQNQPLKINLESFFEYHDLSDVEIAPEFANGKSGLRTGKAEIGLPQLYGTAEGRGASYPLIIILHVLVRCIQLYQYALKRLRGEKIHWPFTEHPVQGNKITVIHMGDSRVFETKKVGSLLIPDWVDPNIALLKKWGKLGLLNAKPMSPAILPLQLACVGELLLVAVPAEFTTVAGKRLRNLLESVHGEQGISRVIVQGFANSHSSYVTTPEEYIQQGYEGGCTHFGKWTLPAYLTLFKKMSEKMKTKKEKSLTTPVVHTREYLDRLN